MDTYRWPCSRSTRCVWGFMLAVNWCLGGKVAVTTALWVTCCASFMTCPSLWTSVSRTLGQSPWVRPRTQTHLGQVSIKHIFAVITKHFFAVRWPNVTLGKGFFSYIKGTWPFHAHNGLNMIDRPCEEAFNQILEVIYFAYINQEFAVYMFHSNWPVPLTLPMCIAGLWFKRARSGAQDDRLYHQRVQAGAAGAASSDDLGAPQEILRIT